MVGMSKAKSDPRMLPKRFYAAVGTQQQDQGFCIMLDGKTVKTPQGKLLHCASQQLVQQIVQEWEAQTDVINADVMPLTRLLNIALDRVPADRVLLLEDIARYCETDLLFYRELSTTQGDAARELALLQQKHFTPILDWCSKTYGIQFALAQGVMPVEQLPETLQKLCSIFAASTDHELAALAMMVPLLGSALLALALWKRAITVEEALISARLDETTQAKYWGEDAEVVGAWATKARDIRAAAFFLTVK
jgi:chaperone required for assembly of F1-ATPase